ncbi:MAG: RHS repeat domain-containing protein [Mucilaginibacter sp.]
MIYDRQDSITNINWSVYGKIQTITDTGKTITYTYNTAQERVAKTANGLTTWYVKDAQGNPIAIYDNKLSQINWREQHIYGNDRVGMWQPNMSIAANNAPAISDTLGHMQYEGKNHLGNVLVTYSDIRLTDSVHSDYKSDVTTAQDYYAFGALMPGRNINTANTRYGFNGKENDNEVKGTGNQQDYGMRIYDPRVGKFLSIDPIASNYAALSTYQFASNRPIDGIDIDGLEFASGMVAAMSENAKKGDDPMQALKQTGKTSYRFIGRLIYGTLATAMLPFKIFEETDRGGHLKHNSQEYKELQVEGKTDVQDFAVNIALYYTGAKLLIMAREAGGPVILDFFGGSTSNTRGAINIDPQAQSGFKGTIEEFVQVAKKSRIMGGVDKIIANNPYGYSDYLADAAQLLKKGGTITVRGTESNRFFNQILKGTAKGLDEFEVVEQQTLVPKDLKKTMKTTSGKPVKGDVYEIILKRK